MTNNTDFPKVSIVIPVYNRWDLVYKVLTDIKEHCPTVYEVIVVNDASPESDVYEGLEFWEKLQAVPLKVVTLNENVGFLLASNTGLKAATGDVIILLSDDVSILTSDFIPEILWLADDRMLVGAKLYTESTGWNSFGDEIVPYLEGWCLAATSDGWKKLGYFDERYSESDFEDVDLSKTAKSLGMDLAVIPPESTHHLGAQSYGYTEARRVRTVRNRKLFAYKWGLTV